MPGRYLTGVLERLEKRGWPLLVVWHSKHDPMYFLATDTGSYLRCYTTIFDEMDKWTYYRDIEEPVDLPEGYELDEHDARDAMRNQRQWELLTAAREGRAEAAFLLISTRNEYEYERVSEERFSSP